MFFVLRGQRKNSVSERGIRRFEVRFLIRTKKHLSLFRAQNLPSLISLFTNNIPYYAFSFISHKTEPEMLGSGVVIITVVCLVCCTWFLCIWSNELRKKYHVD